MPIQFTYRQARLQTPPREFTYAHLSPGTHLSPRDSPPGTLPQGLSQGLTSPPGTLPQGLSQGLTSPPGTLPRAHLSPRDSPPGTHLSRAGISLAGHRRPSKRLPALHLCRPPGPVVEPLRRSRSASARSGRARVPPLTPGKLPRQDVRVPPGNSPART